MLDTLINLGVFAAEAIIIVAMILIVLIVFFVLLAKAKDNVKGKLKIKNINHKYDETTEEMLSEILTKKQLKQFLKDKKITEKEKNKLDKRTPSVFVLKFNGDIKASAVENLREEITAVLNVANDHDEVVVCVDSGGGVVNGYGLAASQLMRVRARNIPLTVIIDKIAASGGYMMACIGNKILAAPFAIVGSIGVVVQMPNFHRLLKDKHIDFELHTAGEYKRTITLFGENTSEGRHKLQEEITDIHDLFKNLIKDHRPSIDLAKVATGEHWLAKQAITLNLVDELKTSDEYLLERSKNATVYEICYEAKKSFLSKLSSTASLLREKLFFM